MMRVVLLGPPGVGKGTVARLLSERYGIPHVSTGNIFRTAISEGTGLGRQVKVFLDTGELVPDELTMSVVKEHLASAEFGRGFLLDGFPRTIPQAEALHSFAPPDHVLNFVADKKKIVERLSGRRTCSKCGAVFHLKYAPPENPEACDACGSRLVQRSDEQPNVILKRLAVYEEQTRPLVDYYQNEGLLGEIDANYGMGEMEKIMAQCEAALKG